MPITDLDIADLVQLSYKPDSKWDFVWRGPSADDLTVAVERFGDTNIIVFPGTTDAQGWMRDFEAWDHTPASHPQLGPVHAGFFAGLDQVWQILQALKYLDSRTIVAGHSLGAARAILLAALLTAAGKPPALVLTMGEPRSGMNQLVDLLAPVTIRSYRNIAPAPVGPDPVWGVPFDLALFPYQHPRAPILLGVTPEASDPWGPLAAHHCELYAGAIADLQPQPKV